VILSHLRTLVRAAALVVLVGATGCSASGERIAEAQSMYVVGNLDGAYATLTSPSAKDLRDETRDGLLWRLEEGAIAKDLGRYGESAKAFQEATTLADQFDQRYDKTSVAEEFAAAAVNSTFRVFRGTYADRIQMELDRAVTALLAGDGFTAAVAARRAVERQRDTEKREADRIAKVEKEIGTRGGNDAVKEILGRQGVDLMQAYAPYLNPAATWMAGMLELSTGDGNDRQRGETNLRRALAMVPEQRVLQSNVAQNPFDLGRAGNPQVVVYFENGVGPALDQITIPLVTPWLGLSTIPLPRMTFPPLPATAVDATGGTVTVRTEVLADVASIWKRAFDQSMPEIILRTAIMVAAKEGATYAATIPFQKGNPYWGGDGNWSGGNQAGYALVLAAASLYKAATNKADLRTWRSIPSQIAIAQLPRPADGRVTVRLVSGSISAGETTIAVPDAPVTFLWCRAVVPGQLFVRAVPFVATSQVPQAPPAPAPSS
jgi:hypothetical protein